MKIKYLTVIFIAGVFNSLFSLKAESLSPYPFLKQDFNNGTSSLAVNNNTGASIAGRTLSWTSDVRSLFAYAKFYQFDFVTTLTQVSGQPTVGANAIKNSTATIYLASSLANYNAEIYVGTVVLNVNDFVDADRNPLTTYPVSQGSRFNATEDLGVDFFGNTNLSMSTYTNPTQTLQLRSMFQTLSLNSTAIIGISFASNANEGFMGLTRTISGTDLGNDVISFGNLIPTRSLGFNIEAIPLPQPTLSVSVASVSTELSMANLFPGRSYRVMESESLSDWTQLHAFTAPASSPPALPIDPVTFLWTTPIHPSGKRFYRLEWDN